eukprot:745606_1
MDGSLTTVDFSSELSLNNIAVQNDLTTSGGSLSGSIPIVFEGATVDGTKLSLSIVDPTVSRTIVWPDASGTIVLTSSQDTVDSTMITNGAIQSSDISSGLTLNDLTLTSSLDLSSCVITGEFPLVFEGDTVDSTTLRFQITDPVSDRVVVFPDASGNVITTGSVGQIDSTMIADGSITTDKFTTSGITLSNLATAGTVDLSAASILGLSPLKFSGSTSDNGLSCTMSFISPTANRFITFPDASGTLTLTGSTSTVSSGMILDGTVVLADVGDSGVNSAKIVDASIATDDFADNAVVTNSILNGAIQSGEIADGTILSADFASGISVASATLTGTLNVQSSVLQEQAAMVFDGGSPSFVTSFSVTEPTQDNIATFDDLGGTVVLTASANRLSTPMFQTDSVNLGHMATGSISSDNIVNGAIAEADIDNLAVSLSKVKANAITSDRIIDLSIGAVDFGAQSITSAKIADNVANSAKIMDNSIVSADLSTAGLTIDDLATTGGLDLSGASIVGATPLVFDGTLDTTSFSISTLSDTRTITFPDSSGTVVLTGSTDTVTGTELASASVGLGHMVSNSISSSEIVDGSVAAEDLGSNAVTNAKLASGCITSSAIVNGDITSDDLSSNLVLSGTTLTGDITTTGEILGQYPLKFYGSSTANDLLRFQITDPTLPRTVTWPDASGDVILEGSTSVVTTTMIADSTLQTADFAGSSIVSSRILDGSISAVDFATGSATLTKLAADSVNGAKIASGSVSTADFSTSGISLTDLTVTGVLTASGSIIAGQTPLTFDGSSVGGTSLIFSITSPTSSRTITFPDQSGTIVLIGSTSTVSSNMIVDGTLATVDFLNDCVTKAKINPNFAGSGIDQNVDGSLELAANWMSLVSFSTAEAGAGLTITTGEMHLAVDAVGIVLNGNTLELGASGVTTAKLGTDSVTTAKIAAG